MSAVRVSGLRLACWRWWSASPWSGRTSSRSSWQGSRPPRQNQQALRSYTWLEKVELSLKGEVKSTKVSSCRYGPDGKVQKTPVVEPPPPQKQRGLKGKMVAKKTGEMKAELESAAALVHQYVPPSPDKIQVVMNAGTASLSQAGPGAVALKFPGYVKAGDSLALTFDTTVKTLRQIDVATWLEEPSDTVTFRVAMQSLPDRHRLPRGHHADDPREPDRGPHHEQQLPEARAVEGSWRQGRVPSRRANGRRRGGPAASDTRVGADSQGIKEQIDECRGIP